MTHEDFARICAWCDAQIGKVTEPHPLAEIVKLRDAIAIFEANGKDVSDAEIQALAERIVDHTKSKL